jgi:dynein light chain LC8-type
VKALDKYNVEKDMAAYIKKEFDKKYNPAWHCIVGRNFGKGCFPFLSRLS